MYCLANDGTQARDRVFAAIRNSINLHKPEGIEFEVVQDKIVTSIGSVVAAVPCNASGAAGANPSLTVFTEVWAYTTKQKWGLYSEMTPPPTRADALRIIESYAGYLSDNTPLRQLYTLAVEEGRRYNGPGELPDLPVWVNDEARVFYFYDTLPEARRLPWQTDQYYAEQQATLPPMEFLRIHANQWIGGSANTMPVAWLERCISDFRPPAYAITVLALDAGITRSAFAAAVVAHGDDDRLYVLDVRIWDPKGHTLDLVEIEGQIMELVEQYEPVEVAYDPFQLLEPMQRMMREHSVFTNPFSQHGRTMADSTLVRLFQTGRIVVPPSLVEVIRPHYLNTALAHTKTGVRFVPVSSRKQIDAMVALAMASYRALSYVV